MKQPLNIHTTLNDGNSLVIRFDYDTNRLCVDVFHKNERGGCEVVNRTIDASKLLAHCEPAIDVMTVTPTRMICQNFNADKLRTPDQWSDKFGVEVIDPDGWRGSRFGWAAAIHQDTFIQLYKLSTVRIVDKEKFLKWQHLFR